ncbi:hypothetical protein [Desulfonatronospira sp.]|uniref:hypothetical protein n=1 Tax=Desulfonatronospira sp. TaxID=1962951 RepID=UPI0025BDD293|nr:hypothetical protein [Desulfonatronospira sp.]
MQIYRPSGDQPATPSSRQGSKSLFIIRFKSRQPSQTQKCSKYGITYTLSAMLNVYNLRLILYISSMAESV